MLKRLFAIFAIVLFIGTGVGSQGQLAEVELVLENGLNEYEGTRDTTIFDDSANSNGGGKHVFAGQTARGAERRTLIAFDLSELPEGATVNSVSFQLTVSRTQPENTTLLLHRLTADWGEGERVGPGQEGTGASAVEGDATWESNFHGNSSWKNPGGDFVEAAGAEAIAGGVGETVTLKGDGLVADVQTWLDGDAENFGWVLIGNGTAKRFHASEGDAEEGQKPRLVIRYTPAS